MPKMRGYAMKIEPITREDLLDQVTSGFWETFPPYWNMVRAHIRGVASEQYGITVEQFHILRQIRKGIHSGSELAAEKRISRAAISKAVDTLVNQNLISRQENPQDRRFLRLELTAEGATLLAAIFDETRSWMKQNLFSLSEVELESIVQAMTALKKTLPE
jgi:DNA-binding MarR family transcriptional regulator